MSPRNPDPNRTTPPSVASLLTADDVQSLLRCSRATAYQLMATSIPVVHLGRSLRVRPEAMATWLAAQESVAGEAT